MRGIRSESRAGSDRNDARDHVGIPARDRRNPQASAFVGWDRPLQTYFAQVLSAPDEDGEEIELVWVGTAFGELPRAVDAIRVLEPYCQIEASLAAQLEIDRMACLATRDGPNQLEAKAFMARLSQIKDGSEPEA
ncbi:hypothetical protein [Sphingomonas sp. 28-62-20]|uniref:hypothetical protein n=1 Tax=Sphingomonas sp. 28-62-20 TaxID=1970433 RepID=UPI0026A1D98B